MAQLNAGSKSGGRNILHEGMININLNRLSEMNMSGIIKINRNSTTLSIGSLTSQYSHFISSVPFYFEPGLFVKGDIYAGPNNSDLVLTVKNIASQPNVNVDKVDGYHVNDQKNGTDTTADNALWTANKIKSEIKKMKDEILGGASEAYDTLKELQDAILNDNTGFDELNKKIEGKLDKDGTAVNSDKLDGIDSTGFKQRAQWSLRLEARTKYKLFSFTPNDTQEILFKVNYHCVDGTGSIYVNIYRSDFNIIPAANCNSGGYEFAIAKNGSEYTVAITTASKATDFVLEVENAFVVNYTKYTSPTTYSIPSGASSKTLYIGTDTNPAIIDRTNVFKTPQHFSTSNVPYYDPTPTVNAAIKSSDNIVTGRDLISKGAVKTEEINMGYEQSSDSYRFKMVHNKTTKRVEFNFL